MEEEKTCDECGYCKQHIDYAYCSCTKSGIVEITDFGVAKNCQYYDDNSWVK